MINIEETIEKVKQNRFGDIDLQNELCDSLIMEAERIGNIQLKGEAMYYKAETLFNVNQQEACFQLTECLEYLKEDRNPELVARINNLFGIALTNKEDYPGSLNYYLIVLKICDKYGLNHVGGLCCCNIAVIFQMIGFYDKAVDYYERAVVLFEKTPDNLLSMGPVAATYSNIFMCLYKQNRFERLEGVLEKIHNSKEYFYPEFTMDIYDAICFDRNGEKEKIEQSLSQAVEKSIAIDDVLEYIDNYQFLCEVLLKYGQIIQLSRVLDVIEGNLPENYFPKARMDFVKYRIACCKEFNNMEMFVKKAGEYVSLYEKTVDIYHKSIRDTLNLRLYVDKLKEKEDSYKKEALVDNLTGLYNRNGLREHASVLFELSNKLQRPVSAFIIDIDYFKQYNDCYGHILGDEVIKAVAGVIKNRCTGECVAARFGGDEFVIIGINIDEQRLKEISGAIVADVSELKIESEKSPISDYVSVSVGAFLGTPESNDTIKGLIKEADRGLYTAKENGRNTYAYNIGHIYGK